MAVSSRSVYGRGRPSTDDTAEDDARFAVLILLMFVAFGLLILKNRSKDKRARRQPAQKSKESANFTATLLPSAVTAIKAKVEAKLTTKKENATTLSAKKPMGKGQRRTSNPSIKVESDSGKIKCKPDTPLTTAQTKPGREGAAAAGKPVKDKKERDKAVDKDHRRASVASSTTASSKEQPKEPARKSVSSAQSKPPRGPAPEWHRPSQASFKNDSDDIVLTNMAVQDPHTLPPTLHVDAVLRSTHSKGPREDQERKLAATGTVQNVSCELSASEETASPPHLVKVQHAQNTDCSKSTAPGDQAIEKSEPQNQKEEVIEAIPNGGRARTETHRGKIATGGKGGLEERTVNEGLKKDAPMKANDGHATGKKREAPSKTMTKEEQGKDGKEGVGVEAAKDKKKLEKETKLKKDSKEKDTESPKDKQNAKEVKVENVKERKETAKEKKEVFQNLQNSKDGELTSDRATEKGPAKAQSLDKSVDKKEVTPAADATILKHPETKAANTSPEASSELKDGMTTQTAKKVAPEEKKKQKGSETKAANESEKKQGREPEEKTEISNATQKSLAGSFVMSWAEDEEGLDDGPLEMFPTNGSMVGPLNASLRRDEKQPKSSGTDHVIHRVVSGARRHSDALVSLPQLYTKNLSPDDMQTDASTTNDDEPVTPTALLAPPTPLGHNGGSYLVRGPSTNLQSEDRTGLSLGRANWGQSSQQASSGEDAADKHERTSRRQRPEAKVTTDRNAAAVEKVRPTSIRAASAGLSSRRLNGSDAVDAVDAKPERKVSTAGLETKGTRDDADVVVGKQLWSSNRHSGAEKIRRMIEEPHGAAATTGRKKSESTSVEPVAQEGRKNARPASSGQASNKACDETVSAGQRDQKDLSKSFNDSVAEEGHDVLNASISSSNSCQPPPSTTPPIPTGSVVTGAPLTHPPAHLAHPTGYAMPLQPPMYHPHPSMYYQYPPNPYYNAAYGQPLPQLPQQPHGQPLRQANDGSGNPVLETHSHPPATAAVPVSVYGGRSPYDLQLPQASLVSRPSTLPGPSNTSNQPPASGKPHTQSSGGVPTSTAGSLAQQGPAASYAKPSLPMCPNDGNCLLVNNNAHYEVYRHTCCIAGCTLGDEQWHTDFFIHSSSPKNRNNSASPRSTAHFPIPATTVSTSAGTKKTASPASSDSGSPTVIAPLNSADQYTGTRDAKKGQSEVLVHNTDTRTNLYVTANWSEVTATRLRDFIAREFNIPTHLQLLSSTKGARIGFDDTPCSSYLSSSDVAVVVTKMPASGLGLQLKTGAEPFFPANSLVHNIPKQQPGFLSTHSP
ncbi:hypothetical protein DIPPA_01845 [Diplonema papillatum]|nr:hypothetical protein DIPPA_01845 [Diplonema papillatum]